MGGAQLAGRCEYPRVLLGSPTSGIRIPRATGTGSLYLERNLKTALAFPPARAQRRLRAGRMIRVRGHIFLEREF